MAAEDVFDKVTYLAETPQEAAEIVTLIQKKVVIKDTDGNVVNTMKFDLKRLG